MKQKLLALLLCLLLLPALLLPAAAAEIPPLVIDNAGLMSSDQVSTLEAAARQLRQDYQMDVVILTVPSLGGVRPQDYADDYFDDGGYGCGEDDSGVIFLLSMEERDWYISTSGGAQYALTDYGIQASAEAALPYLSAGEYYDGFAAWLAVLTDYLVAYQSGDPKDGYADYSGNYYHGDSEPEQGPNLLLSLLIGLAAGGIAIFAMGASMNSKRPQRSAASYLAPGSYHLRTHQNIYLYSNVTKTPRPKDPPASGGGSSLHRSSSGRSHGGGGGKF